MPRQDSNLRHQLEEFGRGSRWNAARLAPSLRLDSFGGNTARWVQGSAWSSVLRFALADVIWSWTNEVG
jgi:hypothetical protein